MTNHSNERVLSAYMFGRSVAVTLCVLLCSSARAAERTDRGLEVLYRFDSGQGDVVHDRSGVGSPLNLKISKLSAVHWQRGALSIRSATTISSSGPAKKIVDAIRRSNAATIEAWIRPNSDRQRGPARIVSLSADSGQRNFTLGQEGKQYRARFRTTETDANGLPETASPRGTANRRLTHLVYTRDATGAGTIYLDGNRKKVTKKSTGNLSNWSAEFPLLLANEMTGDRPWLGELHLVAIYSRALSADEVAGNFVAGHRPRSAAVLAQTEQSRFFETRVAPLLARSCLECHDSGSKKGRLDLSRKATAFAGGESGEAIIPGKVADSLLWQQIDSNDMPPAGAPLSAEDKATLRRWIANGAFWSGDVIDPATYAHSDAAADIWVQRLTVSEYIETVRAVVGVDIEQEAREILPPDLRADGFSNTAYNLNVDLKHVASYARLASIIASRMDVLKFAAKFSKSRSLSTDDTMRDFTAAVGKWLLRGPLNDREISNYSGIATTVASAGGDYQQAVALMIEAMLQSPRFIYRIESQRGDGTPWPVSDYELASRISYIVWGGPPDQELMRAAEAGELQDRGRCESQVQRMLKDERAIQQSHRFLSEWLNLDRLDNLQPSREIYPDWNPELAGDMREETLAFFEDVTWRQQRPLSELLNAQLTYVTPRLAKHYGLPPQEHVRYDVSEVPARGGLLTQGSVLTVGGDDGSMVTRGLFVLHDLLRGTVKDPPPGLDTTPVPPKPGLSHRTIAEQRIGNVACGGCHAKFEPLAFAFEKFDGLGTFREKDKHGNQLREDGELLFPGAAKPVKYQTTSEFMDLLANSPRVKETITRKLTQFSLGRPLGPGDTTAVREIHQAAWQKGGTYASLITAIVTSDLVQLTRTEAPK